MLIGQQARCAPTERRRLRPSRHSRMIKVVASRGTRPQASISAVSRVSSWHKIIFGLEVSDCSAQDETKFQSRLSRWHM